MPELQAGETPAPDYEQFSPVFANHCAGTKHQDIQNIEKIVFLGDSVTKGTPPTPEWSYYANLLTDAVKAQNPDVEMVNCAAWGARTDDIVAKPNEQLLTCVPEPEPKTTWVVMTVGGNDTFQAAQDYLDSGDIQQAEQTIERAITYFSDAIHWMRDNESTHFPGGLFITFANVYEFTDATGDMGSCPAAEILGFEGNIPELTDAYIYISEAYMKVAVDTQSDMLMLLEHFCGHGFHADDPNSPCYRGPDAENWFDGTCIHPTPTGHQVIAELLGRFLTP